jgi:two-component system sensor histidine kinase YesM
LNLELVQTKRFLFIVVIILILLSALIASFVSRTLSSPLKRLIREMKQVEIGNFSRTLEVTSYQEMNILVASFNHMVIRIGELIERVKKSSVSEKNAELQALQTQVNPHFLYLYNTLDMIYWTLDEKGNDKLGEIVLSLSHMFRYSSHWDEGAEVTLREEVEQIRHYLTIIAARLDGRVTFEMDIDEQWMNIRLPKMTLQPIIENSVKYGLEPLSTRPGVLRLSVNAEERYLKLMVSDNGIGIDETSLEQVRYSLTDEGIKDSKAGIGLQNLQLRLHNRFGGAYGIMIDSKLGEGAAVTIVLPLPQEGDNT